MGNEVLLVELHHELGVFVRLGEVVLVLEEGLAVGIGIVVAVALLASV